MKLQTYKTGSKALCLVDMPSLKCPMLFEKINSEQNVYISPLKDSAFEAKFYKCEIASVPFVLALLAKLGFEDEFRALDEGYLSAECCLGEEEAAEILEFLKEAQCIIFDANLKWHADFESILYFLDFLSKKFKLELVSSDEKIESLEASKDFHLKEPQNFDSLVLFNAPVKDLEASFQFMQIAKAKPKDEVLLTCKLFQKKATIVPKEDLKGTIALYDFGFEAYNFIKVQISTP